jgi:hypothetical protein
MLGIWPKMNRGWVAECPVVESDDVHSQRGQQPAQNKVSKYRIATFSSILHFFIMESFWYWVRLRSRILWILLKKERYIKKYKIFTCKSLFDGRKHVLLSCRACKPRLCRLCLADSNLPPIDLNLNNGLTLSPLGPSVKVLCIGLKGTQIWKKYIFSSMEPLQPKAKI